MYLTMRLGLGFQLKNLSNMKKEIIGVIGMGFVGNAVAKWFTNKQYTVRSYDKFKSFNSFEETLDSDIMFLCLPTLFSTELRGYDYSALHETLEKLQNSNYEGTIVIKSTTQPKTIMNLHYLYSELNIVHNPEFLTARTSEEDFANQKHIVLGYTENEEQLGKLKSLYKESFPDAEISTSTSTESELMKIFANSFYAVKVQFFNEMFDLCKKLDSDYSLVISLMLKNGWINPMHTTVPGPDGKLSYGGACFPKDTQALYGTMLENGSICEVLGATISERNKMRKNENTEHHRDETPVRQD